uniref:Methyltransferase PMT26 n=1 Tax=Kalanchoe fedtschenkoi TaxID=63787 RepID=A0A7N0RIF5_KALFE
MAGRYSRVDGRKSTSYCSAVTIAVFVAFCLVGVWMFMSSSAAPFQNSSVTTTETKVEDQQIVNVPQKETKQFEDIPGDLPEDTTKGNDNVTQNETDNSEESSQEDTNVKRDSEEEKKIEERTEGDGNKDGETDSGDKDPNSDVEETKTGDEFEEKSDDNKSETNDESKLEDKGERQTEEEKVDQSPDPEENSSETKSESQEKNPDEVFPAGAQSELLKETTTQDGTWSNQATESKNEKESQKLLPKDQSSHLWKLCNVTAGPDYIPCLDNIQAIKRLTSTKHYEHRERHCPDEAPTCLVPLPDGYKRSIKWPNSRDKIWYHNVPHTKLAVVKGHQNWVKVTGEYLTFPGGGTQFTNGALHYIDFIQESLPDIAWGKRSRVVLDVGCGVASFGGFLFERDVLTMSLAPKDEHEAQVQFALERGIPAISAVMGTKRLPFPSRVFDVVHCARCRVPWHAEGGKLLLELNRVLRPGGYFVWSATPVYRKVPEDVSIWEAMTELTKAMCWELVTIGEDKLDGVSAAIYRKPLDNECYDARPKNEPPMCSDSDDANAAWNVELVACMHKAPVEPTERGSKWPEQWPARVGATPYWLKSTDKGVYGKSAPEDFNSDREHWKHVVTKSYLTGIGIDWSTVRNVMDMRAIYGGFAAALKDLQVWVMNVVPVDSPDTLAVIYERGLFGIHHDWCESFSTYPRTYDLLHADHLFSAIKKRCKLEAVIAEVDRILRPEGKLIIRDNVETINEVENLAKSLHWDIRMTYSKDNEGLLCIQKTDWRPTETETILSAIA